MTTTLGYAVDIFEYLIFLCGVPHLLALFDM